MARRRTVIRSLPFALDSPNRDEHFEEVLAELFDRMGKQIVEEYSLHPRSIEIELTFHRKEWDGWIEVSQDPGFGVELNIDRMKWYKSNHLIKPPKRIAMSNKPDQPGVYARSSL